jgi:hypothetical protein
LNDLVANLYVDLAQRQRVGWFTQAGGLGALGDVCDSDICCLLVAASFDAANSELLNKIFPDGVAGCENVRGGSLG